MSYFTHFKEAYCESRTADTVGLSKATIQKEIYLISVQVLSRYVVQSCLDNLNVRK